MRAVVMLVGAAWVIGLSLWSESAAQPTQDEKRNDSPVKEEPKVPVKGVKAKAGQPDPGTGGEEPFDQRKADLEVLRSAGYADDTRSLIDFFRSHTVNDENKARIQGLIQKLGDDAFEVRQQASAELAKAGVGAIALLRAAQNQRDADPEVVRRCRLALQVLERVPTRTLAVAAARTLAGRKDEGIVEALMGYLPLADDEGVRDEILTTLASVAVREGKPEPALEAALKGKDALLRAAAAEALARSGDKATQNRMKEWLKSEASAEVKLRLAVALVGSTRDKDLIPDVIRLMVEVGNEQAWRAEDLLWRLAGEDGPMVALGNDPASRDKTRDEWLKWWEANKGKIDMARLDEESSYGLTIVCEMPFRGGLGRVVALGGDGKVRWEVKGLNWPMDAVPLAGRRILIAEHNANRIIEREIDGNKIIWMEPINQPVNVGRLPNGVTWAVGRNQIIEWERGDKSGKKQIFTFVRNEYDIVAGARLKSGDYVLLTQNQQLLKVDRKGTIVKAHGVGGNGINYYSTVDVLPNGKVLCTLMTSITEFDLETGKAGQSFNFQMATSAVRLRNGNTLVGNQNNGRIIELDKDGKPTKWQYTSSDASYRAFRAFRR